MCPLKRFRPHLWRSWRCLRLLLLLPCGASDRTALLHPPPLSVCGAGNGLHATKLSVDRPGFFGQMITVVDAPSGHIPMLKRFQVLRLKIEIQHTVHIMDGNHPDLEAFESNLRRTLLAR